MLQVSFEKSFSKKYLFIGCAGSSLLCRLFSSCGQPGLLSRCGAQVLLWLSCCRAQALRHTGSVVTAPALWSTGSVAVAQGACCSMAHGIFSDQGSNPCLLHWQVNSSLLSRKRSLWECFLYCWVVDIKTLKRRCLVPDLWESMWKSDVRVHEHSFTGT